MKGEFITKNIIWIVLIAGLLFGGTLYYWFKCDQEIDKKILKLEFSGKVTEVRYDVKQFPFVTVNGREYYIGSGYDTDHQIAVGDSLIKKQDSFRYKLIKQGMKAIYFDR